LAQLFTAAVGFGGKIIWDTTKPNGQPRRRLDVSRAKQLFGFQANYHLCDGIPKTVEWFKKHRHFLREVTFV